jgi:hypothetical protein
MLPEFEPAFYGHFLRRTAPPVRLSGSKVPEAAEAAE